MEDKDLFLLKLIFNSKPRGDFMFRINIVKLDGTTWAKEFETMDEVNTFVSKINEFGHPDEWDRDSTGPFTQEKKVIDQTEVTTDDNGITVLATPEISHQEYFYPRNYTYTVTDLSTDYEYLLQKCYENRRYAYGQLSDQIDEMYRDFEAWKTRIAGVKAQFPKPVKA